MNDLYESLKNSQLKKKRLMKDNSNENKQKPFKDVEIGIPLQKINQVRKLVDFQIFDVIKRTYILDYIEAKTVNEMIKEYRILLYKLSNPKTELRYHPTNDNSTFLNMIKLSNYLRERAQYDRTSFKYNPKYYPTKSKIDLVKLNATIQNTGLEYSSITKLAAEYSVSYSTMYNIITKDLGYQYKCVPEANSKVRTNSNIDSQKMFFLKHFLNIKDNYLFIYLDEASFNNKKKSKRRWVNKRMPQRFYDFGRFKSMSLMLCISKSGIINYSINEKTNNSDSMIMFLKDMTNRLKVLTKTSKFMEEGKVCLIMDNAVIHKSKNVLQQLWKSGLAVLYLPPYHPKMNAVEYCFRSLKNLFYRRTFSSR